ncbi:MAG: hypothetical protein J5J00_07625 [Deltaproteobacteria bacterium]|nr:hypothetical protein [Deltaproteobacteria bacterium]
MRQVFIRAVLTLLFVLLAAQPAFADRYDRIVRGVLPKKPLQRSKLAINAFVNDQRFGSISSQFREVRTRLKLKKVRVLFAWNDDVQPSPNSPINFSFYDEISRSIPRGTQALVILTGIPTWMRNQSNWIDGNPRKTFAERWVRPVVTRYRKNSKIKAWQFWNEPNMESNQDNVTLQMADSPGNYVELLAFSAEVSRSLTPRKKVVSAATTAINQNFPESLEYNEDLKDAGMEEIADIWAVHIYGERLETILFPGGVGDFLNDLKKPIWITESGEKGVNNQLSYAQEMWPFLFKTVPGIKRLYIYQFTESTPAESTYGLKNLTPGFYVSDLYIYLRDKLP